MRLTILTVGSRGDVQPFIALGAGFKEAGYNVRLATHETFEAVVRDHGLDFFPVYGNPREILESEDGKAWLESNKNPILFFTAMARLVRKHLPRMLLDGFEACKESDAVIFSPLGISAVHATEKLKIPGVMAALQPIVRTGDFASPATPPLSLGRLYNQLSHFLAGQLFWQPYRKVMNQWRKETLGLPPMPLLGPFHAMYKRKTPVFMGYSPSIIPRPSDWPGWVHVTGYWYLDRHKDWIPDPRLVDFLQSGPPPVYVGFGSMTDRDPEGLKRIVLGALRLSGRRAILHSGWAGLTPADLPDDVFLIDSVPHDWLFPRMSAVVHHGGAGTTSAAFRAGVPAIVVPFFGDQHFWAHRVGRLKTGPAAVPRKRLTAERLADAISQAFSKPEFRKNAEAIAGKISAENGIQYAIDAFHRIL